ncbi:MAG: nucleotide exchange factor GrpE [Campylobacter sp.]|nr:nucleotide exchange factor GrpE [Campylobacter sp.]
MSADEKNENINFDSLNTSVDTQTQGEMPDIVDQSNLDENIDLASVRDNDAIAKLEAQVSDLTDKYYRCNADFENMKKRFEKEKADIASYANEKFARDLLNVLDALEMGANFTPSDEFSQKIKEGIQLSINEFKKVLEKNGIVEVSTQGGFDPNFHNAIMSVVSENEEITSGQIVSVMQKGYTINGRVLRPAMVSIAK